MRRRVSLEYGIEVEIRERRWVLVLGEVAWWIGAILVGMGLALWSCGPYSTGRAWILTALHGAGSTP